MITRKLKNHIASISIVVTMLLIFGCSDNPLTGYSDDSQGIPTSELNFVPWNAEMTQMIRNSLNRGGYASETISASEGGTIGGEETFGNSVLIPPGALSEDMEISVEVLCVEDGGQCGAGVQFLPSQNFNAPIKITLSWEYLDLNFDNIDEANIYFSQDGDYWYQVDNLQVDEDEEVIVFWVDHFTVYAWEF